MGDLILKKTLNELIQSGFNFEVNRDKLLLKGDLSLLTDTQKLFLKENKSSIIALIQNQTDKSIPIQKWDGKGSNQLSYSQQGIWLLDRINDGSNQYNITSAFQLKGTLDYEALKNTFLAIIQRHESLRSTFDVSTDGHPIQNVQSIDSFEVDIEVLDPALGSIDDQVVQKFWNESNRVFDLKKDLLIRVHLLRQEEKLHFLIINTHHIASDGWSMGLLVNEFSALYNSFVKNEPNPLPELPIQYSDYANWQRQWLNGNVMDSFINYWKHQLTDLPLVHNLPLDKPRPRVQRFKGSSYTSFIDQDKLNSLRKYCQNEQASLFMGVHAVFSALLARYSNEKDIVVGSPIANREKIELANLVGVFMNLIVLRSDLSENPSFIQLLRQSKKVLDEAYEFQQMPFDRLVDELKVQRSLSHSPLFQVLLTFHNEVDKQVLILDNLTLEPYTKAEVQNAKYDLSLDVYENQKGLRLVWEYNTDLFEELTINNLAFHFNSLLASMLTLPEENVFSLDLIGDKENEEYYQLLKGETSDIDLNNHVIYSFQSQLDTKATEVAVTCNNKTYTYKDLGEKVDLIANELINQGVKEDDKVGLCLLRNIDLVASIFACFKLGVAYIPLDPIYPAERLTQIINDAQPKCVLSLKPLKRVALNKYSDVSFIYLDMMDVNLKSIEINVIPNLEQTAYIIFTSGTTGKPKGIEISHLSLANLLKSFDGSFGQKEQQKWLAQTSINFDISVLELIWTISRGHNIVLQPSNPVKLLAPENLQQNQDMDFSIMFFGADKIIDQKYDLLLDIVKFADNYDFTAIWTPERHFGEFGGAFPSPSVLSAALAVLTKKLQIRSGSVVLPLHDPVRVAEEWSIVDNLSNGRVGLSVASGWHPNDFVFNQADYSNRKEIMQDKVTELKKLWKGGSVIRKNGVGQDFEIKIRPRPIQRDLPIWVTAAGNPKTFEYAGEIGANILTHLLGQSFDQLVENIRIYHKALKDNGYRKEDTKVSLMLHTYIESTSEAALSNSELAFKGYLESSVKLVEPIAKAYGLNLDINTQRKEIIDIVYQKFSRENTLIGSPESCQNILLKVQSAGVNEVACLVDFGVDSDMVLNGLQKITETKELFQANRELYNYLEVDEQKNVLELIESHQVNHVQMTPSQSKMVWNLSKQNEAVNLPSIKRWFIGGEAISESLIKDLSTITEAKFYNMYGPTETTVWSAWREITPENVQIGAPILNTELLLLNEFGQEVPVGVIGELYIGGKGLAKGYYNNSELTSNQFKTIERSYQKKGRFYKTGDLLRFTQGGTFEFIGRTDNQVKVNGYRIELEDIEQTIIQVVGVKNCKVLSVTEENQTHLSAYVSKNKIVQGEYKPLPEEKQAKPFHFPDGSILYCQSDRQIGLLYKEIFEDSIYFKHGINVGENAVILDVGANVGGFSIDLSQRHPDATIIAFEPIPQTFSALKQNFEHRQIKGVLYNYGVSNKREKATFYYYPEMSGMSGRFANKETIIGAVEKYFKYEKESIKNDGMKLTVSERETVQSYYDNVDIHTGLNEEAKGYLSNLYSGEPVDCQLIPLSDVIDAHNLTAIDLLKIDVERSERLVLEGIREEHWTLIRQLVVEVDGDDNLQFAKQLLEEKNYKITVDVLAMSDAEEVNEENTYLLYAIHNEFGRGKKEKILSDIGTQVTESAIREVLKQKLPDYMSPKHIYLVDDIPLMENGKVDLMRLKSLKPKKAVPLKVKTSMSELELEIYQIWCEVLKREDIPYHISIFEAGGGSIEMVLLHEKLQNHFKVEFSLIELFRKTTLEQQAIMIKSVSSENIELLEDIASNKAEKKGTSRRIVNRKTRKTKQ